MPYLKYKEGFYICEGNPETVKMCIRKLKWVQSKCFKDCTDMALIHVHIFFCFHSCKQEDVLKYDVLFITNIKCKNEFFRCFAPEVEVPC